MSAVCPLKTRDIVERILLFIEQFSGVHFYTYQSSFARRIIESVLENDGETITGLWSRQSGKTEAVANTCAGLICIIPALAKAFPEDPRLMLYARTFSIGIFAPIEEQADLPFIRIRHLFLSDRCLEILSELDTRVIVNRTDRVHLSNGASVTASSASPDTKIEGGTHNLIILEEAQQILRSKFEKDIKPMAAATNGTFVKIGTAWLSRGGFHNSIQENIEVQKAGGKRSHFEFPYDIVLAEKKRAFEKDKNPFHNGYAKFVNKELNKYGPDSEEFKMNFRLLWHESRVIAINKTLFCAAARDELEAGPSLSGLQVAGLDIGKVHDSTILTIMRVDMDNPIVNKFTLPGADEDKQVYYQKAIIDWCELGGPFEGNTGQYQMLVERLGQFNIKVLCIDATSIGDPVYERITELLGDSIVCIPFHFSSKTKSELYKYYLQELNARRLFYAAGPRTRETGYFKNFQNEHFDLDRFERSGYTVCAAPEGGHDDYPDSAALACWAAKIVNDVLMPDIIVTKSDNFKKQTSTRSNSSEQEITVSRGSRYASKGRYA